MYECIYCGKNDFRTERGLDQHLVRSAYCQEQREADEAEGGGYYTAEEGMTYTTIVNQAKVKRSHPNNLSHKPAKRTSVRRLRDKEWRTFGSN